ncbi:MarR family winged helix-turn-helix transcriptional regulator [Microlunatus aurantiacus]|uniref:MarR family winged helix-turn-helix transcriptional regulator n=1 Tax=Microlunatus aurantiacus TaxID=446786 RepID=A0ABP7DIL5_9ACTN
MTDPEAEEPRWLSEEQLASWQALMSLVMTLPAALDAQLKRDAGLNSFDYHVLAALADHPGEELGMGELASFSQGSPSRLSHAVSRLEREGWIERSTGRARCVNARLTAAGRQKLVASAPGHVAEARRLVVDVLTPHQLEVLGEAARLVTEQADPAMADALARRQGGSDHLDRRSSGADDRPGSSCPQAG